MLRRGRRCGYGACCLAPHACTHGGATSPAALASYTTASSPALCTGPVPALPVALPRSGMAATWRAWPQSSLTRNSQTTARCRGAAPGLQPGMRFARWGAAGTLRRCVKEGREGSSGLTQAVPARGRMGAHAARAALAPSQNTTLYPNMWFIANPGGEPPQAILLIFVSISVMLVRSSPASCAQSQLRMRVPAAWRRRAPCGAPRRPSPHPYATG